MSEAVSQSDGQETKLKEIRALLADGMLEKAAQALTPLWLEHRDEKSVIELYAELMEESGRSRQSEKIKKIISEPDQPLPIFEAAFSLIDIRQFALAAMLLKKCDQLRPDDPIVNYELGFALMSLAHLREAIVHFKKAQDIEPDFDTTLNLAVCYVLTRDLKEARAQTKELSGLAVTEEELKELAHRKIVLNRLEGFNQKKVLSPQDWLFVLYGGILLHPVPKLDDKKADHIKIAETLLIVKGFLEGLRQEIEVIEYYNTQSRPLTRALSELMEIPLDSYKGPNRPEQSLLVMDWAMDIIGPHESFIDNTGKRLLFAYGLPRSEPLPLLPDIVGYLTQDALMPWHQGSAESQIDLLYEKILDKARDLETEPEVLKAIQDLILYYEPKREQLIFANPTHFPERPEYSAEVVL